MFKENSHSKFRKIVLFGSVEDANSFISFVQDEETLHYEFDFQHQHEGKLTKRRLSEADFGIYFLRNESDLSVELLEEISHLNLLFCIPSCSETFMKRISSFPLFSIFFWNAYRFDGVFKRIMAIFPILDESIDNKHLLSQLRSVIYHSSQKAKTLHWVNPPDSWSGEKEFFLNENSKKIFSVGELKSQSEFRLPLSGNRELFYFQFVDGHWTLRNLVEELSWNFNGNRMKLCVGDELQIESYQFTIEADEESRRLLSLYNFSKNDFKSFQTEGQDNIYFLLRQMMLEAQSGEVSLISSSHRAFIYLENGFVVDAYIGAVRGMKALLRIFALNEMTWKFNKAKRALIGSSGMRIDYRELERSFQIWLPRWKALYQMMPLRAWHIIPTPKGVLNKKAWTYREHSILSHVVEYQKVSSVFDYCPYSDLEILMNLVHLRKESVIRISKNS